MISERVERYDIEPSGDGIVLRMRQGRRALGIALISLAVLLVSWWFGPYGPRPAPNWGRQDLFYWIWSSFFSIVFVLALAGALFREDWTIRTDDIIVTTSVGPWRRTRQIPKARALGIRLEIIPRTEVGPIFPYRLHVLDAERKDSQLLIELQLSQSVDRFLAALRSVLKVEVYEQRM
jgi:hypothetical protein